MIDKPQDFTSFDVVAVLRGSLQTKKIGHSGTLDPMATGVLPVFVGMATKAIDLLPDHDKEYIADFQLGAISDTGDIWGQVSPQDYNPVTAGQIKAVLQTLTGEISQIPPMYSAIRHNGVRLYDLARQGQTVEREPRPITVYENALLSFDEAAQAGQLRVSCSKGTYIRTLIEDMGQALNTGALMTNLRRTKACGFSLDNAICVEEARTMGKEMLSTHLLPMDTAFALWGSVHLTPAQSTRFANGGFLDLDRLTGLQDAKNDEMKRVYAENVFLGIGQVNTVEGILKVRKQLSVGAIINRP